MNIVYEKSLLDYMKKKKKDTIIVEIVTANCSDIEISELHVHLIGQKQADYFRTKKKFRAQKTEAGEILLPPYRLELDEMVTFGVKSFLGIKQVTCQGIRL